MQQQKRFFMGTDAGHAAGGGAADRKHRLRELQGMLHNRRLLAYPSVSCEPSSLA